MSLASGKEETVDVKDRVGRMRDDFGYSYGGRTSEGNVDLGGDAFVGSQTNTGKALDEHGLMSYNDYTR